MNLAVTAGDPLGIGPEITVEAIRRVPSHKRKNIIIIGSEEFLKKAGWNYDLTPIIPVDFIDSVVEKRAAFISFKSLEVCSKLIKRRILSGVVTAPVSKDLWLRYGIGYNGHTDYFRKVFGKDLLMCFMRKNIIGGLVTEHIALKDVSRCISKAEIVKKVKILVDFLKRFKKKKPRIAISSLNPHCGEGGMIGDEERKHIIPAVRSLRKMGIDAFGPLNPDDCIKKNLNNIFDASLFMYHDQLIPLIKALDLSKNDVVHITLGLDFIRTSPTHGSARDIAWKRKADHLSMLCAINTAYDLMIGYPPRKGI